MVLYPLVYLNNRVDVFLIKWCCLIIRLLILLPDSKKTFFPSTRVCAYNLYPIKFIVLEIYFALKSSKISSNHYCQKDQQYDWGFFEKSDSILYYCQLLCIHYNRIIDYHKRLMQIRFHCCFTVYNIWINKGN